MVVISNKNFSLEQIANSGQCFRMNQLSDTEFEIISKDKLLLAYQDKDSDKVSFDTDEQAFDEYWKHYFDLDTDYGKFTSSVDINDAFLSAAVDNGRGIRILNQDLWEMIVSFLVSQQNNIKRIRKCIDSISRKYGTKCVSNIGREYYAFPTPSQLALADEDELMACNLGYRSKYVVRTANAVVNGAIRLDDFTGISYQTAKERLLKLYGVGNKVADCICLFALHHIEAFPIDTHIKQVLEKHYKEGFPFDRYDGYSGVMQQYIFYYELN